MRWLASILLMSLAIPASAQSVTITFSQVGANVQGTLSGSIDTTGLSVVTTGTSTALSDPAISYVFFGPNSPTNITVYSGLTGPANYGTGNYAGPDTASGSGFGFYQPGGNFYLATGYASGSALSGAMTFDNEDFTSLGLAPAPMSSRWVQIPSRSTSRRSRCPGR